MQMHDKTVSELPGGLGESASDLTQLCMPHESKLSVAHNYLLNRVTVMDSWPYTFHD